MGFCGLVHKYSDKLLVGENVDKLERRSVYNNIELQEQMHVESSSPILLQ